MLLLYLVFENIEGIIAVNFTTRIACIVSLLSNTPLLKKMIKPIATVGCAYSSAKP